MTASIPGSNWGQCPRRKTYINDDFFVLVDVPQVGLKNIPPNAVLRVRLPDPGGASVLAGHDSNLNSQLCLEILGGLWNRK